MQSPSKGNRLDKEETTRSSILREVPRYTSLSLSMVICRETYDWSSCEKKTSVFNHLTQDQFQHVFLQHQVLLE